MRFLNKDFPVSSELMKPAVFPTESSREMRARARFGGVVAPLIFVLVAACALAIFYYASLSKGSNETYAESEAVLRDPAEAEKKLSESQSFEAQFNAVHEFKKDKITGEDIDVFEKAVDAYSQYLAYAGIAKSYNPRMEQMRKQLHDLRADIIRASTTQIEQEAETLASQKKYAEAETLFTQASKLEYRITQEFPLASKKNHARANFLENRARTMHAIPMQLEAQTLTQEGEAALDAGNWPKANTSLSKALVIEKELWRDYRNVIISNDTKIRRLQTLLTTIASAPDYERRERHAAAALAAEAAGDRTLAAQEWERAYEAQCTILRSFPQSLYADEAQKNRLAVNRANAAVYEEFADLEKKYAELRAEIRSRQTARVPLLAKQVLRKAEHILHDEPESTLVTPEFLSELRYMDVKAQDIGDVQKTFFEMLLPVPGTSANIQMSAAEVTQALYTFVMPFNPSASNDLLRPVESVDFNDATEFCRRLSLIVGCEVRLPTKAEFSAAAGTPGADELPAQAWLLENSSGLVRVGKTRNANANGFFDLYGNVSEWLLPEAAEENASAAVAGTEETAETYGELEARRKQHERETLVAGGDCQTPAYAFPQEFFKSVNRSEKSRTRGFRVVADIGHSAFTEDPAEKSETPAADDVSAAPASAE